MSLQYELPPSPGTGPGLKRIQVTNKGEEDWRGLIWAEECRDYTPGPTAELEYEAAALTALGGAELKTRSGSYATKVVRHSSLSNLWQAILGSEIVGEGHMTHVGVRRLWARIYDPGSVAGEVQLRLEWRSLGSSRWTQNRIIPTPLVGGFQYVDLGECRPQTAVLGDQRWEWRLTARTKDDPGATIDIDLINPLPAEQYALVRETLRVETPTLMVAEDRFQQSSGSLNGKTATDGTKWVTSGSTTDLSVNESGDVVERSTTSDSGGIATARRAVSGVAGYGAQVVSVDFLHSAASANPAQAISGLVLRSNSLFVRAYVGQGGAVGFESSSALPETAFSYFGLCPELQPGLWYSILSLIDAGGLFAVWVAPSGGSLGAPVVTGRNPLLATGGALSSGKPGFLDANLGPTAITRSYRNFAAWSPEEEALCYASRALELRSDGVFRQDASEDVWGGPIAQDGFLPYDTPGDAGSTRGIVIASPGDFDGLPDGSSEPVAQVFRRPAFHATRGPAA